ncbi:hypothetical protein BUALT_Bualt06G0000300 [Buddleja alternifolia]|uniref:Uncharacterized protein n=1 Tax=Buddleja alternifolia TaxID=168488 RepID=A0AAV6XM88_9LAMI|nr:hypothetical protein BUALT_Bualt06G0000300 [Buddleja alternifolia]
MEERVFEIWIGSGSFGFFQKVIYKDPHLFCTGRKLLGHDKSHCLTYGKNAKTLQPDTIPPPQEDLRQVLNRKKGKRVVVDGSPATSKNPINIGVAGTSKVFDKSSEPVSNPVAPTSEPVLQGNDGLLSGGIDCMEQNNDNGTNHMENEQVDHIVAINGEGKIQAAPTSTYNQFHNLAPLSDSEDEESDLDVDNLTREDSKSGDDSTGKDNEFRKSFEDEHNNRSSGEELDSTDSSEDNVDLKCDEETKFLKGNNHVRRKRASADTNLLVANSILPSQVSFNSVEEQAKIQAATLILQREGRKGFAKASKLFKPPVNHSTEPPTHNPPCPLPKDILSEASENGKHKRSTSTHVAPISPNKIPPPITTRSKKNSTLDKSKSITTRSKTSAPTSKFL